MSANTPGWDSPMSRSTPWPGLFPIEAGVPDEFYPDFYTYCPALDQFVDSRLEPGDSTRREYLRANLDRLKENARLAVRIRPRPRPALFRAALDARDLLPEISDPPRAPASTIPSGASSPAMP